MARVYTVPVLDLSFEVPADEASDAENERCRQVIRDLLDALPYDPVFEVGEAYTWSSFVLAPKEPS